MKPAPPVTINMRDISPVAASSNHYYLSASVLAVHGSVHGRFHLSYGNGRETGVALHIAFLQIAAGATGLMIDDLMLRSPRKPLARRACGGKGNRAWNPG